MTGTRTSCPDIALKIITFIVAVSVFFYVALTVTHFTSTDASSYCHCVLMSHYNLMLAYL